MTDVEIATSTRFGDAPILVFCDHASNALPADLECLGLPDDILQTHIAWDIGAGALTTALAEKLDASAFACGYSRLIVDPNRAPTSHDFIPAVSDQIPVPGNQMLSEADRALRTTTYHEPYHQRLAEAVGDMVDKHDRPFIVSVHSFTNRLMGAPEIRPWEVGLLWSHDPTNAQAMIAYLKRVTSWEIGDNEPYDAREFNYSVNRHVGARGLAHLTLEVRQDLICDEHAVIDMATMLAEGVGEVARSSSERAAAS